MNLVARLSRGFFSPLEGARIIFSSPKNTTYAVIPFFIGLVFIALGFAAASQYLDPWIQAWLDSFETLQDWPTIKPIVNFLVLLLTWLLVSIVNFIAGYICIIVVAGPFYALMVEGIFTKELNDQKSRGTWKLMLSMLLISLLKIVVFAFIGLICFLLAFVPGLNIFTSFALVLLVAFDCTDYAFEVDYLNLRQRFRFLLSHIVEFSGLGLAILATGVLPGSFFLLLPIFICGATKMYIQLSRKTV